MGRGVRGFPKPPVCAVTGAGSPQPRLGPPGPPALRSWLPLCVQLWPLQNAHCPLYSELFLCFFRSWPPWKMALFIKGTGSVRLGPHPGLRSEVPGSAHGDLSTAWTVPLSWLVRALWICHFGVSRRACHTFLLLHPGSSTWG